MIKTLFVAAILVWYPDNTYTYYNHEVVYDKEYRCVYNVNAWAEQLKMVRPTAMVFPMCLEILDTRNL